MKTKFFLTAGIYFLLSATTQKDFAQSVPAEKATLISGPQSVTNSAITNPDVLVITGKITDASTNKPITNAKINFDKFGEELLRASVDDKGNYAIALNKKELGEPVRIIFRVAGYKKFIIKSVDKKATYLDADLNLQPMDSDEKSDAKVKYVMSDDPSNPLVIKMQ